MIHDQSLTKDSYQKSKLKDWRCTKMNDYFTICQYKTDEPKNIEISTSIFSEVWLSWCETGIFNLDLKWLPSKFIIKCTGLKMQSYELRYFNFTDTLSQ